MVIGVTIGVGISVRGRLFVRVWVRIRLHPTLIQAREEPLSDQPCVVLSSNPHTLGSSSKPERSLSVTSMIIICSSVPLIWYSFGSTDSSCSRGILEDMLSEVNRGL